jgi:signal transduction histidine kinase
VLVLVLALFGIYVTHKIAGPVYALRQFIHAARSGQWERVRSFRKGDEFTYLAEEFKELAIQIRAGHARDVEELRDVMRLLQAGDVEAARSKVAEISRLHESHLKG